MTSAAYHRNSYEACGQRLAVDPAYIDRTTRPFFVMANAHIAELMEIRAEERRDREHTSMVKRYHSLDGNFDATPEQIAAIRRDFSEAEIVEALGCVPLDSLKMRYADLLRDHLNHERSLK